MSCSCKRWCINLKQLFSESSLETNFRKAIQCIQPEEWERISLFRFKDDALSSLVGRLMLRQAVMQASGAKWSSIKFARTEKGKPYLVSPEMPNLGLNVSHQGDFVAFGCSCAPLIGVDCMGLIRDSKYKTADEYITFMQKSFSKRELATARMQPTDTMKLTYFYRYWCLKESIIKAIGVGIHTDLSLIDFGVNTQDRYRPGCYITSTTVNLNDGSTKEWAVEESFLDQLHTVAVCREAAVPKECRFHSEPHATMRFSKVSVESLLEGSEFMNCLVGDGAVEFSNFDKQPKKPPPMTL